MSQEQTALYLLLFAILEASSNVACVQSFPTTLYGEWVRELRALGQKTIAPWGDKRVLRIPNHRSPKALPHVITGSTKHIPGLEKEL